jgi:hypothetical protein
MKNDYMKTLKIANTILLVILCQLVSGQAKDGQWEKWNFLIGEWVGEGNGQPGQGEGKFTFQTDLDGNILVRKNHTAFPETATSKAFVHEDLLIVYPGSGSAPQEGIYFDNEGHTIKYKVSFTENSVILTSDLVAGTPRFRLSYALIDNKTVKIDFEIASPQAPEEFKMYLSGKAMKVK